MRYVYNDSAADQMLNRLGAVIANSLLKSPQRPAKVIVLEAREICSGASGRNAGHCRPDPHRGFTNFAALHGTQEAREICESEAVVLERYVETLVMSDVSGLMRISRSIKLNVNGHQERLLMLV